MARVPSLFSPGSLLGAGGSDPFLTLHREMNRLFDDVLRGGPVSSGGGQGGSQGGVVLAPHMDVSETDKELHIQAELPGVSENDIEVSLHEDVLTIRAEKKQERKEEREGAHFSERAFGTFHERYVAAHGEPPPNDTGWTANRLGSRYRHASHAMPHVPQTRGAALVRHWLTFRSLRPDADLQVVDLQS